MLDTDLHDPVIPALKGAGGLLIPLSSLSPRAGNSVYGPVSILENVEVINGVGGHHASSGGIGIPKGVYGTFQDRMEIRS